MGRYKGRWSGPSRREIRPSQFHKLRRLGAIDGGENRSGEKLTAERMNVRQRRGSNPFLNGRVAADEMLDALMQLSARKGSRHYECMQSENMLRALNLQDVHAACLITPNRFPNNGYRR